MLISPKRFGGEETFISTWADGTDEEIAAMILVADNGEINLSDYWAVGDKRHIDTSYFVSEGNKTYPAQTMEAVLMQEGLYKDANDKTINFVAGFNNLFLNDGSYINELLVRDNQTSRKSWSDMLARTTCNEDIYNALPQYLQNAIKIVKVTTGAVGGTNIITEDKIFLAAEKEVIGVQTQSLYNEAAALTQFEYYTVTANRCKGKLGMNNPYTYWLRSPVGGTSHCRINYSGGVVTDSYKNVIAPLCPHFCI